jgi:hemerythrin
MMEVPSLSNEVSLSSAPRSAGDNTMTWSDRYLLGHAGMDNTHRDFVACVAALQTAEDAELEVCLAAFEAHAVEHFEQERDAMQSTEFPAAQCHMDEHTAVLNSIHEVQEIVRKGGSVEVIRQLTHALVDWFPNHADYLDASLAQWLVKRSHGGAPVVLRRRLTIDDTSAVSAGD